MPFKFHHRYFGLYLFIALLFGAGGVSHSWSAEAVGVFDVAVSDLPQSTASLVDVTQAPIAAEMATPYEPMALGDAFDRHASLAFFSIGSLAVGGILVGIRSENKSKLNLQSHSPDRDIVWALGMAGLSSLIAGGAFWYYVRSDLNQESHDIAAQTKGFSVSPLWDGTFGISAKLTLGLSSILP